uniref:Uncharacterized protein n=1 Tax=Aegilops tauschii subsp. strangulata TaxID=200361 RepID=A0A453NXY8_AEGTS
IADHAKPKAPDNVTAELKLGSLSISILDSSCGMGHTNFRHYNLEYKSCDT